MGFKIKYFGLWTNVHRLRQKRGKMVFILDFGEFEKAIYTLIN